MRFDRERGDAALLIDGRQTDFEVLDVFWRQGKQGGRAAPQYFDLGSVGVAGEQREQRAAYDARTGAHDDDVAARDRAFRLRSNKPEPQNRAASGEQHVINADRVGESA